MHSSYFQAIIQLRNPRKEVEEFLIRSLGNQISNIQKVRNGLDYYVKDNKRADRAAINARDKYGGEYNVAATLHTRDKQSSKGLYRLSILLRLPDFKKGDVIKFDNKVIKVKGLGKKASGLDLKTGKSKVFKYPDKIEILKIHKTRVVKIYPEIEVLHPTTFQSVPLQNPKDLKMNEKVKVIEDRGIWIV